MKKLILVFWIIIISLIVPYHALMQSIDETRNQPLSFSGSSYGEWSSDSQWFTYIDYTTTKSDPSPTFDTPSWIAYMPETKRYIADQRWWLQPLLSSTEESLYSTTDLIRTSPDGELILFSVLDQNQGYMYHLANRTTQQIVNLNINGLDTNFDFLGRVFWSEDGNILALTNVPSPFEASMDYWYVEIPNRNDLLDTVVKRFPQGIESPFEFQNGDYFTDRLFDINSSGTQLLLSTRDLDVDLYYHLLLVWYPNDPQSSYIIEGFDPHDIATVAFSPLSEDQILILYHSGELIIYDLITTEQRQIASVGEVSLAYFSPDEKWLAFRQSTALYILDIESLISQSQEIQVTDLVLVDDRGEMPISDTIIVEPDHDAKLIQAKVTNNTTSVLFDLNGSITIDDEAPFEIPLPTYGSYTLIVLPYVDLTSSYEGLDGNGISGISWTMSFSVND